MAAVAPIRSPSWQLHHAVQEAAEVGGFRVIQELIGHKARDCESAEG